jgi:hypothetical protein
LPLDSFVEFYSVYPDARLPSPASPDLSGAMPVRAYKYCLPLREAAGLGFYIYPPADFAVTWDGDKSQISFESEESEITNWRSLEGGRDEYLPFSADIITPDLGARLKDFNRLFTDRGLSFINADPRQTERMEITTGIIARTPENWGLLVQGVHGLHRRLDHDIIGGYIQTDWFRGYIPIIITVRKPNTIVRFFKSMPIAQVIPISRRSIQFESNQRTSCSGVAKWPSDIWDDFVQSRSARQLDANKGSYMKSARKFKM